MDRFKILIFICFGCTGGGVIALNLNSIYTDMAIDFFQTKNITNVIMLLCWPAYERVKLMKQFFIHGIKVSQPIGFQDNLQSTKDMFRTDMFQMGIVFDVKCYVDNTPSLQRNTYFNASYVWLSYDYGQFEFIINYTMALPMTIVTDAIITKTIISEDNETYSIELYDVYSPGPEKEASLNVTYIGRWIKDDEENNKIWKNFILTPKVIRRGDLKGLDIIAVTLAEHKPYDMTLKDYLEDERNPFIDSVFRMNYRLVKLLKEMYNFTIQLLMADNWTDKNSQGFYRSGNLIGLLSNKKADVMAGALQLMYDRITIVDVLHMTYPFRAGFIFRFSGDFGNIAVNFLKPFDDSVWIIMVTISLVLLISVWCILVIENKYFIQIHGTNFSFGDAVLSILTAWCQMGSGVRPSTYASRLVYLTLFFNSLIIYNFYTSSIVSSLLSYRSRTFSIIDLADSPIKCGSVDVGYVHNLLFDIPVYPNMKYFNERKKRDPFYFTIEEGVRHVKEGSFAFHSEFSNLYSDIANTFEPTEICELQEVDTISYVDLGIFAQKHSPYTEMFRVGLAKARETGQIKRLLDVWVVKKPVCQAGKGAKEVNLHQTVSVFFVLVSGQFMAVLIMFFEKYKWKKSQMKKPPQKKLKIMD